MRAPWLLMALIIPATVAAKSEQSGRPTLSVAPEMFFAGKSTEQIHSPILVYHQLVSLEAHVQASADGSKTESKGGFKFSLPADGGSSRGSSSGPKRTTPRSSEPTGTPPAYGGPSDARAASMDNDASRSTNPCSRDGYHDNVMKRGLDGARQNCQLHQLDKNRWQLWALSGGDPLLRKTMEKHLDKALDIFKVPK